MLCIVCHMTDVGVFFSFFIYIISHFKISATYKYCLSFSTLISESVSNLSCWFLAPGETGNHRFHTDSWLWSVQRTATCSWSWTPAEGASSAAAPAAGYELLKKKQSHSHSVNPTTIACILS